MPRLYKNLPRCGAFPLHLGHDLFSDRSWRLFITRKMHGVIRTALRARPQVVYITEHLRQRHDGLDDLRTGAVLHALDASAARTQIAHHRSGKIFRSDNFHRHHRLEQHRRSLARGFLKCHRSSDLECHFAGVDFVVAAVVERGFYVHDRIAGQNAALQSLFNALIHRLDVFLRNYAADDFVDELETLAGLVGLELDLYVAVLAAAAGLANELTLSLRRLANGFAIRHLRLAYIGFYFVLAHHAINDDLQMQLAHAADDCLSA